jgi:DNA-directed RNA polymerase specialized sigma24 family protein
MNVRDRVLRRAESLGIMFPDENPDPATLTEKDWFALSRHVRDGWSYADLQEAMGVTYGTISGRVSGAQWKLFRHWEHQASCGRLRQPRPYSDITGLRPEDV